MKPALFWHRTPGGGIECELCPHHCRVADGKSGRCGIRAAAGGAFEARGYGRLSGAHLDPIEKKPLYHYLPGSVIFSIGGWGCNLACVFCQNWTISQQADLRAGSTAPADVVKAARQAGSIGIAYTYNEPLINIEFVRDCAELAGRAGLANVLVTNGFIEEAPAAWLLPLIDALNIDIKSMDEAFYRRHCRGTLAPVLRFARQAAAAGRHVEITNLVIPGLNDDPRQIGELSRWIRDHLGRATPLHLSAYRPEYRMTLPPTPPDVLERAHARCREDLDYVYIGNLPSAQGQATLCPRCGAALVERHEYSVRLAGLRGDACARCGRKGDLVLPRP